MRLSKGSRLPSLKARIGLAQSIRVELGYIHRIDYTILGIFRKTVWDP